MKKGRVSLLSTSRRRTRAAARNDRIHYGRNRWEDGGHSIFVGRVHCCEVVGKANAVSELSNYRHQVHQPQATLIRPLVRWDDVKKMRQLRKYKKVFLKVQCFSLCMFFFLSRCLNENKLTSIPSIEVKWKSIYFCAYTSPKLATFPKSWTYVSQLVWGGFTWRTCGPKSRRTPRWRTFVVCLSICKTSCKHAKEWKYFQETPPV